MGKLWGEKQSNLRFGTKKTPRVVPTTSIRRSGRTTVLSEETVGEQVFEPELSLLLFTFYRAVSRYKNIPKFQSKIKRKIKYS